MVLARHNPPVFFLGLRTSTDTTRQSQERCRTGVISRTTQAFIEILESKGASYVVAIVDFGWGPFPFRAGCNPHVGGE